MRFGVVWLTSVLALAPLVLAEDAKEPGKAVSKPAEQITFVDNFQTDRRARYTIAGPVQWKKGRLLLAKGATIRKSFQAGPVAQMQLELDWPSLDADTQTTQLSFGWEVEDCGTVWVQLTLTRNQGKTVTSLRIVDRWTKTTGEGDSAKLEQVHKTIRTFCDLATADVGKLTISYRHGLVRVHVQGKQIAIGHVSNNASLVDAFVVRVTDGEFACMRFALTGAPRPAPLTDQQQAEVAEMQRLDSKLGKLYRSGKSAQAVLPGNKALAIAERIYGESHPEYATRLNNLALMYWDIGECAKALPLYLEAMRIRKEVLGPRHPSYATSLNNLASLYGSMGEYAKALPLYLEASQIGKEVLGPRHPSYALSLNNLASLYRSMSAYAKALPLYLEAMEIHREALGSRHPSYATSLNNLASLYDLMGEYAKALPLYLEALRIRKEVLGSRHPNYAASLNNLASLYRSMGEYAKALPLYLEAMKIHKEVLGSRHAHYAGSLHNLASLYRSMSDYAKALPLYLESMEIYKEALGTRHPGYATSLNDLAAIYRSMGEYAKALPLYLESMEIYKEALGPRHPDYATSLNNLAGLYKSVGEYAKALPLYLESMEIRKEALGPRHPSYATSLNNLALLYRSMSDYAKALPLCFEAMKIRKEVLGPRHPSYATSLNNLSLIHTSMGDFAKAEPLAREAFEVKQAFAGKTLPWLPEARAMAFRGEQNGCDTWLSALRRLPDIDPAEAYAAVWQNRALVTRVVGNRRKLLLGSSEAEKLYAQLQSTSRQLAQLTLATPKPRLRELRRQQLARLSQRKEQLQTDLAALSQEFRRSEQVAEAGVADLAALLPIDTAVVDLVQMRVWSPPADGKGETTGETHYEAFVLRRATGDPGYRVAWIHLGLARPINQAVARWRARNTFGSSTGTGSDARRVNTDNVHDAPGSVLRRLIWQKLESQLTGCTSVVIIPDAALNFVPWGALPGAKPDTYLIEDYAIATASHGQQLYALLAEPGRPEGNLLLVGAVAYGARTALPSPSTPPVSVPAIALAAPNSISSPLRRGPATTTRLQWEPLEDTRIEIDAIRQLLRSAPLAATTLEGPAAGEQALCAAMPASRYVHLATHGFFADERFRSAFGYYETDDQPSGPGQNLVKTKQSGVALRNPLILSGLVLAGANLPPETDSLGLPTGEDGILTAEEIVSLNLRSTELVVLSACETGLGKVGGNEGVMGLARAFHMAGARTVVASLWQVDDPATRALMTEFYTNFWVKKLSKLESLRQAQLTMLRRYDQQAGRLRGPGSVSPIDPNRLAQARAKAAEHSAPLPPAYWAAFVLSGDWR